MDMDKMKFPSGSALLIVLALLILPVAFIDWGTDLPDWDTTDGKTLLIITAVGIALVTMAALRYDRWRKE